jgi:hypothetical protein
VGAGVCAFVGLGVTWERVSEGDCDLGDKSEGSIEGSGVETPLGSTVSTGVDNLVGATVE